MNSQRKIIALLIAAFVIGIALVVGTDRMDQAGAVEYFHQGAERPIQPVSLGAALPELTEIVKQVKPCVVNISTKTKAKMQQRPRLRRPFGQRDPFFDDFFDRFFDAPQQRERKSLGSGFVINDQGNILTNRHVIAGADEIVVHGKGRKKIEATLVGEDDKTDIAVLKVEKKGLPYCNLGDSDQLEVGDWVMAMGNPFGLESTVTVGIVSAKGRVIGAGPYDDFIQTDASINPGNSGGPLFDLSGRVVGINTAIVASGQGIGFAIPINMAKELVPQLISEGKVTRGWLGVGVQDMNEELAKSFGLGELKGALIANVFEGSPASRGGLESGDVILEYNGKVIQDSHELPAQVARTTVGETVPIKVLRDGKERTLKVKIAKREDGELAGVTEEGGSDEEGLGIAVRDISPEDKQGLGLAPTAAGVYIARVEPGSTAARSDVRPGDILISINGKKIHRVEDYVKIVKRIKKGQVVRFFMKRGDMTIFVAFTK